MKSFNRVVLMLGAMGLLAACSSPEDKKARAEAEYTEEKTKTLQEYKECVQDADDDQKKLDTCERLLNAVKAVESK